MHGSMPEGSYSREPSLFCKLEGSENQTNKTVHEYKVVYPKDLSALPWTDSKFEM